MKHSLGLSLVLVLAATLTAQASISPPTVGGPIRLVQNDTITLLDQNQASEGYGGAFDWEVASVVQPTISSSKVGTVFQSFCIEIQQEISRGSTYTVSSVFVPKIGQSINTSGNTLQNFQGIYLFDYWSEHPKLQTAALAGAVQIALWESEGYLDSSIEANAGFSSTEVLKAKKLVDTVLKTKKLSDGSSYSSAWQPDDVNAIELTNGLGGSGVQDQIVLVPTIPNTNGVDPPDPPVPEPATIAIWAVGIGLAGASALRRRKQASGRWSADDRQAIFQVIDGKR